MLSLEDLFSRRLLLITGKGGVGKSTTAAALALIGARLGKKILLVEINSSGRLWQYFNSTPRETQETPIYPSIYALNLNPHQVLQKYIIDHTPSKKLAYRIVHSPFYNYFVTATPGIKEIMALGKIMVLEREGQYDLIIVDIPATGHGLSLLKVPQVVLRTIELGPVNFQTRRVYELLKDQTRTLLNIVTLAEEMALRETREIYQWVDQGRNISLGYIFINGLYPPLPPTNILELYQTIAHLLPNKPSYFQYTDFIIQRRQMQERYLAEFRKDSHHYIDNMVELPFVFSIQFNLAVLEEISKHLEEQLRR
jgi:anion-transporting  ArsA/GET3 family ATPase